MPELPEVEVTRRRIAPLLCGREIEAVTAAPASGFFLTPPATLRRRLVGRRVLALARRGKYLVGELDDGSRLLLHLGMTGQLLAASAASPRLHRVQDRHAPAGAPTPAGDGEHVHLRLRFRDGGEEVRFRDPRRFGRVQWLPAGAASPRLARLGVDALDATPEQLRAALARRRAPIKALLLDQSLLAGVGNIYADEALFRAGIHPLRRAGALTREQCDVLAGTVRDALEAGLAAGGATIDDFRHPDGVRGTFQDDFLVHRREGEDCPRCGGEIVKFVVAGRGTYVCERCQPRPRGVRRPARAPRGARSGRP